MRKPLPTRAMREHPDIDQLKRQAKELLEAFTAGEPDAIAEVNQYYRHADPTGFALHTAQLVIARSYGFDSWPKLKAYVDGVTAAQLCDAVERGDLPAVRNMLHRRPEIVNLERPRHGEQRALHVAVLGRNPALVRLLMENGADARVGIWPHRDATSALTFATERGYDEIAAIIHEEELRRGGNQQATVFQTNRDLEDALWSGDQSRAIALLEADPSLVHTAHPDGWTLLHRAAAMLRERVVSWLLEHGADVNRRAKGDWTPLDFAASGKSWDETGSPERFAAVAKMLLQAGAEVSAVSSVALGDVGWIRARHAAGALVNATVFDVFGPFGGLLTIAAIHNRPEMLALLLDLGFDPDERTRLEGSEGEISWSWGMPLHHCAEFAKFPMAEMLLARGADPNGRVCTSGTPVGVAYGNRHWEMVKLLERHGGVVYAANAGYYRDTGLARRLFAEEAAGRLRAGAIDAGTTLAEVLLGTGATGGDPEIVRMALDRIDWPREDPRWYWKLCDPLCFWNHMPGIPTGNPELDRTTYLACFKLVLERCDPNVRPKRFGQTCLHEVATMRRHVTDEEVVAFATALLDAGARLDIRDNLLHSTALGWACRWGRAGMVKLLLDRGADAVETGAEAWARPRAWAEKLGRSAVLAVLNEHELAG